MSFLFEKSNGSKIIAFGIKSAHYTDRLKMNHKKEEVMDSDLLNIMWRHRNNYGIL